MGITFVTVSRTNTLSSKTNYNHDDNDIQNYHQDRFSEVYECIRPLMQSSDEILHLCQGLMQMQNQPCMHHWRCTSCFDWPSSDCLSSHEILWRFYGWREVAKSIDEHIRASCMAILYYIRPADNLYSVPSLALMLFIIILGLWCHINETIIFSLWE